MNNKCKWNLRWSFDAFDLVGFYLLLDRFTPAVWCVG